MHFSKPVTCLSYDNNYKVALWRACNLTLFSPCLTGPVDYLFASRHKGPGFKSPWGTCVKPGYSCKCCLATLVTPT